MKELLPFLLILVVLGSGCTVPVLNIDIPGLPDIPGFGGATVVQYEHDMVVITSLEAIPAEVDAGQTVRLLAYIENRGDKPIDNVVVDLYDYCQGLFEPKVTTCTGAKDSSKPMCTITRLLAKQTLPVAWTLSQKGDPVKLKTICPPDGMKVSVTYPYTTSSLTTISLIGKDELDRTLEERTFKSTESYIVLGPGPIKPMITVDDKQPIPVFKDARTVLAFQISNRGSGRLVSTVTEPAPAGSPAGTPAQTTHIGISKAKVAIKGIGTGQGDLEPATGPDAMCFAEGGSLKEDVRLIGKDSSKTLCKIDLSGLENDVTKTASKHVEAEVSYDYAFTRSVVVTVNPKIV